MFLKATTVLGKLKGNKMEALHAGLLESHANSSLARIAPCQLIF